MVGAALFSSERMDWETPDDLFDALNIEFAFTVDAAASEHNAKVGRYWTKFDNGIAQDWTDERVWINPPYGREIKFWVEKAAKFEAEIAVLLIPSRTDTAYWHDWIWDTDEHRPRAGVQVRLIRGRLKFKGAPAGAPFPSALIVFDRLQRSVDLGVGDGLV